MPVATVQVERLFTCIKKILGEWHLSLNLELVDALLRIAVDGDPMGLTPTALSQVGLYITGIQQLTATQTTVYTGDL